MMIIVWFLKDLYDFYLYSIVEKREHNINIFSNIKPRNGYSLTISINIYSTRYIAILSKTYEIKEKTYQIMLKF